MSMQLLFDDIDYPGLNTLDVYQRTPIWVGPRWNPRTPELVSELYRRLPFTQQLARATPGLDVARLESDLDRAPARALIRQAERQANRLGVSGTPSFFVQRGNGPPQPLELSSLDADSVSAALDSALGEG